MDLVISPLPDDLAVMLADASKRSGVSPEALVVSWIREKTGGHQEALADKPKRRDLSGVTFGGKSRPWLDELERWIQMRREAETQRRRDFENGSDAPWI